MCGWLCVVGYVVVDGCVWLLICVWLLLMIVLCGSWMMWLMVVDYDGEVGKTIPQSDVANPNDSFHQT